MTNRKLGRGLDALITHQAGAPAEPAAGVLEVDPNKILTNPSQPRKSFSLNELEELKASIQRDGILQPVLVRERGGNYELIAGERRLRAAKDLGLTAVPAVVVEASDDRMLELALIENIHRENLNPIELAEAFRQLLELKGWTQEELSRNLSLSRPAVTNALRLLGQITMGHAKVLLSISDAKEQRLLFEKIAEEKLTVRELEDARSDEGASDQRKGAARRQAAKKSPQIVSLEEEFSRAVGTRVRIRQSKGKGAISIEFYTPDDFERIRALILPGGPTK